jgi:SAM-dependent methyltransferase
VGADDKAAVLGRPSYLWRFGQERRLGLIRRYVRLEGARILDVGCGVGTYARHFCAYTDQVYGVDLDAEKVEQASKALARVEVAAAEDLPFEDGFFDLVLLHEVLEHVEDDVKSVAEAWRVTRPEGHVVVFVPNRLYLFETHGVYWRGRYREGNVPLVNYLPDCLRGRLCPHVRAYTKSGLRRLFKDLPGQVMVHTCIYAGYDKIAARHPGAASVLRRLTYALERTPLRFLGLSHFLVFRKKRGVAPRRRTDAGPTVPGCAADATLTKSENPDIMDGNNRLPG